MRNIEEAADLLRMIRAGARVLMESPYFTGNEDTAEALAVQMFMAVTPAEESAPSTLGPKVKN